jgi:hypothetical protein
MQCYVVQKNDGYSFRVRDFNDGPEDGSGKNVWNVGNNLPYYPALRPRRQAIFIIVTLRTSNVDIIDLLINILLDMSTEAYVIWRGFQELALFLFLCVWLSWDWEF